MICYPDMMELGESTCGLQSNQPNNITHKSGRNLQNVDNSALQPSVGQDTTRKNQTRRLPKPVNPQVGLFNIPVETVQL